jgi:hypothetical protein
MSTVNIVKSRSGFSGGSYYVAFATHRGLRRYEFTEQEGVAIEMGSDPRDLNGHEVGLGSGGDLKSLSEFMDAAASVAQSFGETAEAAIAAGVV